MPSWAPPFIYRLVGPEPADKPGHLLPRWLFLRALGLIYFSAFYSLVFQIRGLIGPKGILPAGIYLEEVAHALGVARYWFAPTLLWLGSGPRALELLCWAGMVASVLLVLNLWPRAMLLVCLLAFLSFIAAAQDFSDYQSDGMLLAAGFVALFFAPPGLRPGWGEAHPPSRASLFLLRWEWFRIYFESGVAKIVGGDPAWRHLTAMDEYYQNGPLPSWIGWYAQHLPHWFHASTTLATLILELGLIWMLFLPRRFRLICFFIVTPWEIAVILTANYAFLNYLVLSLGILLLDDRLLEPLVPRHWALRRRISAEQRETAEARQAADERITLKFNAEEGRGGTRPPAATARAAPSARAPEAGANSSGPAAWLARLREPVAGIRFWFLVLVLGWIFYATTALLIWMLVPGFPLPTAPVTALEPFRIANRYGLFGLMTRGRYEIEFQGTLDGKTWTAYPFRYKPQDLREPPGIYAPYQPRFDWNLWFASLGMWRQYPIVLRTEQFLLSNDPAVLSLFAGNPFPGAPPHQVRAVLWQYWFTDPATKRKEGLWWRRELLGLYAPTLEMVPDGRIAIVQWPQVLAPPP